MSTFTLVVSYIDGSATTRDTYEDRSEVLRIAEQESRHSNTENVTVKGPNEHGILDTLFSAIGYWVADGDDTVFDNDDDMDYWGDKYSM